MYYESLSEVTYFVIVVIEKIIITNLICVVHKNKAKI